MRKFVLIFSLVFSFIACSDIVGVEDISDKTVIVLAPTNDAVLTTTDVSFNWQAVDDAEEYNIQIATPNFVAAMQIVTDSTLAGTIFNKTLDSGNYEWRVRAENSVYFTEYTTQKFIVIAPDPVDISNEQVVLLAPAHSATFSTTDAINFSWESIADANEYMIQIATPDFDNVIEIIEDETIANTSFSISNLEANSYEWRVKAINSAYETDYATQSFTIEE